MTLVLYFCSYCFPALFIHRARLASIHFMHYCVYFRSAAPAASSSSCPICLGNIQAGEVFTVDCREQHTFCVDCLYQHCSVQVNHHHDWHSLILMWLRSPSAFHLCCRDLDKMPGWCKLTAFVVYYGVPVLNTTSLLMGRLLLCVCCCPRPAVTYIHALVAR